jgi:hypothetical protein
MRTDIIAYRDHEIHREQTAGIDAFFVEIEGYEVRFETMHETKAAIDAYRLKAEGIV